MSPEEGKEQELPHFIKDMFYLQTASPQSGTDFWVMEKVAVVHLSRAKLSWIILLKKQIKEK